MISFYFPRVFFYRRKRIVRNVEEGPFGVSVIYETTNVERRLVITRVVHSRDVSSSVCFKARNCIRIFEQVLMAHLPIYCSRPGA